MRFVRPVGAVFPWLWSSLRRFGNYARHHYLRLSLWIVAVVALLGALTFGIGWLVIDWSEIGSADYDGGVVLRDASGNVLRVSLGENDVDCRPYYQAERDDWIVKAIVASEDGHFWEHHGVRFTSVLRAAFQNAFSGRRVSGASTISMQTVRLIRPHRKTHVQKFIEAIRAMKMERQKDKLWILSQYLNRAPYGSNFVGIEAAANGWFGHSAKELGPGEAALLAGMVQAPSRFRPDRGMARALKRREYVLRRMVKLGYLTERQAEGAAQVVPRLNRAPRPFMMPYFCDWVQQQISQNAGRTSGDFVTTLDGNIQQKVETAVAAAARKGGWHTAAVVLRVETGEVVALACSGNYFDAAGGQVNTALAARPAGSSLKPFLTALALDRGLVSPSERLVDVPTAFKGYNPVNFDGKTRGLVSVKDALVLSLNIPFVRMLQKVGVSSFRDNLHDLGFRHVTAGADEYGLGLAIGNAEVSLVELAGAYGALASGGMWRAPTGLKVKPAEAPRRIFSEGAAYLVSTMLSGDERSQVALGHMADVVGPRFAWKTGTSAAYRDAWTVAWNPEYVVAVWCGHLSGHLGDKTLVGAQAAAPCAWQIARGLDPKGTGPAFVRPKEVATRKVCSVSGQPANGDCSRTEEAAYLPGRSPTAPCRVHVRDANGALVVRMDPELEAFAGKIAKAKALAIARPEQDATFQLVPGMAQQQIVCRVTGNVEGEKLWWFVDGGPAGETTGLEPFVWTPEAGTHVISCTTTEGVSATVRLHIKSE